jgi:hypothetical protein
MARTQEVRGLKRQDMVKKGESQESVKEKLERSRGTHALKRFVALKDKTWSRKERAKTSVKEKLERSRDSNHTYRGTFPALALHG